MQTFAYIGICILTFVKIQPLSSQYVIQPTNGRTFGLISFFQANRISKDVASLSSKVSKLDRDVDKIERDVASLQSQYNFLNAKVNTLMFPQCIKSAKDIGARILLNQCISVETMAKSYFEAQQQCRKFGGILAEPFYADENFVTNLKAVFSDKISSITDGLYVGISFKSFGAGGNSYVYNIDGTRIPGSAFNPSATPTEGNVGFISNPIPNPLTFVVGPPGALKSFLCKYPVF